MIAASIVLIVQVDLLEYNTAHCDTRHEFSQVIYWIWDDEFRRMDAIGYHLVDEPEYRIGYLPYRQFDGFWMVETSKGVVIARNFRRTRTDCDPEMISRRLQKPRPYRRY